MADAQEELVLIELAKRDFYFFCRYMFFKQFGYKWQQAAHHQIIRNQ